MKPLTVFRLIFGLGAVLMALAAFVLGGYDDPQAKTVALTGLILEGFGLAAYVYLERRDKGRAGP